MTFFKLTGTPVYIADPDFLAREFELNIAVTPKRWKCPCENPRCVATVLYARDVGGRYYFMCNQTVKPEPPYYAVVIDNVEDIEVFLGSDTLPPDDLAVFARYFKAGLKEAIFSFGEA